MYFHSDQGTPEDLMFFYKHLSLGGKLMKIDKELLVYRHHPDCETFSVTRYNTCTHAVQAMRTTVRRCIIDIIDLRAVSNPVYVVYRIYGIIDC